MTAMKRISPGVLLEMIAHYDAEVLTLFRSLDPFAPGLGVAWAGESSSENWFDIAREYTEKWHHQQQIRDATGRPALHAPHLFAPVLQTFVRGLPFAYQRAHVELPRAISLATTGELSLAWTLVYADGRWSLSDGADAGADTLIRAPADLLWRLWTKGVRREEARARLSVAGAVSAAEPLLSFVAVMA
jgi:hypothetical protein